MISFIHKYYSIFFVIFLTIIVGLSFYLGYEQGSSGVKTGNKQIVFSCPNTVLDKQRISSIPKSTTIANTESSSNTTTTGQSSGAYMGSKNGTKYYTPDCSGSKRIRPENVIWFQTVEDATLQGYSKGSC